ncbi:hypothetical protein HELRODRAFT_79843 [Helobdella robusta]|uniref:N(4)-(beta-N-acetylglucosaminyl)-L-asparaginase n=1 Tax=Helobdella robusta TaxID=6412 RepID=T1G3U3_HELRO|nr:hypothetical protein HELRODRAFT_79843 [Helobdella robusta]ESO03549.1 hypothetical protein HELRODRAFT_79843 [Helobdella robusta]
MSRSVLSGDSLFFRPHETKNIPLVISTWNFDQATKAAWEFLTKLGKSSVDAVVAGCSKCEIDRCDGSVGEGGSPDENGESTLDALVMDGTTMDVGAVGNLRGIREASSVARDVLLRTEHSLLVGSLASDFAVKMGYKFRNLSSNESINMWQMWKKNNCQPNFWQNVTPDSKKFCGPYRPIDVNHDNINKNCDSSNDDNIVFDSTNHDTVSIVAIDFNGSVAVGTSSNGAKYKIPGRVGDSPIVGSGGYADSEVGGAGATGDGDVMMRFSPSFHAVELMRNGMDPISATELVIGRIRRHYPMFSGAVIAANVNGEFGRAACNGWSSFPFTVMKPGFDDVRTFHVVCPSNK